MGKAEKSLKQHKADPYSTPYHRAAPKTNQDQPNKTLEGLHKAFFLTESDSRSTIFHFIKQFFQIYDNNVREDLARFFHPKASFGLLTDKKVAWIMNYRNVLDMQKKRFPIGLNNIMACLNMLPRTRHTKGDLLDNKISRTTEGVNFAITGTFEMIRGTGTFLLYYTHRFHLVPGRDGRPLIRHYRQHIKFDLDTFSNMTTNSAATPVPPTPALPQKTTPNGKQGPVTTSKSTTPARDGTQGATGGSTNPPHKLILKDSFIKFTGMFEEHAEKCLQMNNWNWEQAVNAFKKLKDNIPEGCFYRIYGKLPYPPTKNIQIFQFAVITNLRVPWAEKCLSDNSWEWKKAKEAFDYLKAQGKIPTEFFYTTKSTTNELHLKECLVELFAKGSGLKDDWARWFIKIANWDYSQAITEFLFQKQFQQIPAEAFIP